MAVAGVRAAREEDVAEIVRIQASTWRTAYAELVGEAALQRLAGPAAHAAWRDAVLAGTGHHVLVATEGAAMVGFCAAAPAASEDGETAATTGEIAALLVEPRWGRRGHGHRLVAATFHALRGNGASAGTAWVPERDVASRAFYARIGWESDGMARVLDAGDRELREIRLAGPLEIDTV